MVPTQRNIYFILEITVAILCSFTDSLAQDSALKIVNFRIESGVQHYFTTSAYQSDTIEIRVLFPRLDSVKAESEVVIVLPVETTGSRLYGDGLDEIQSLNLHEKYDFVVICPSFTTVPWYADHPSDESY